MMLTAEVYRLVTNAKDVGIKCADIATTLDVHLNTISGILSMLKQRERITNIEGLWYVAGARSAVIRIKEQLQNMPTGVDKRWAQGYVSALADFDYINELEFELLLDWVMEME